MELARSLTEEPFGGPIGIAEHLCWQSSGIANVNLEDR